ncbi:MAG TPA: SprT family zinc-dependent metalloprotease [Bacteroidota bacterium]|nr:SprT family zinc-dependent metalloprotease [Bacteroidota bacterium]
MRSSRVVKNVDGIGEVILHRSRKARRFSIRVEPFMGLVVVVPWNASYRSALEVVERHRAWVTRHLVMARNREAELTRSANTGRRVTRMHILEAHPDDIDTVDIQVRRGVISVCYPRTLSLESATVQKAMRDGVASAYRLEARRYLPDRVRELAHRFGFRFGRLTLKNLRTRWGSCSTANNINLNIQLMRLPDELIDFVILHELVHTQVKDHGPKFWRSLERVSGNAKSLDAKLRKAHVWG